MPSGRRSNRLTAKRRRAVATNHEMQAVEPQPSPTPPPLLLLPDGVITTMLSFLAGETVANFACSSRATLPFLHSLSHIILTNQNALPALIRRLRTEGIRHLHVLQFEQSGPDVEPPNPVVSMQEAVRELIANPNKVPELHTLDIGEVAVTGEGYLRGLRRLSSLNSLTLPTYDPPPLRTEVAHRSWYRMIGQEIMHIPKLTELHVGSMTWDNLVVSGLFKQAAAADANAAAAAAGAAAVEAEQSAMAWRQRIRTLNMSMVKTFTDAQLQAFMTNVIDDIRGLEELDLSFAEPSANNPHVAPCLSDLTPVAEAFRQGALSRLRHIDFSFQVNVSNPGLNQLAKAWLEGVKGTCWALKYIKLRDMAIGHDPEREEAEQQAGAEQEGGVWDGLRSLGLALGSGNLVNLVELDLQDNFLRLEGFEALVGGLKQPEALPNMETLDLTMGREEFTEEERKDGAIRLDGCLLLCKALENSLPRLKRLGLGGHLIGHRGIEALCHTMDEGGCPILEELDLTSCRLGDKGALYMADWLASGPRPSLRRLMLGDNGICGRRFERRDPSTFQRSPKSSLTALNLERNQLGDCDVAPILRAFLGQPIRHIVLARNYNLGGQTTAAASLGRILRDFPQIEGLDLMGCGRHRHLNVKAMMKEITQPINLTSFILTKNHIGAASIEAFLKAAPKLPKVVELEIDGHGSTCSRMLQSLLSGLRRGLLPALLSLTFTCLDVKDGEAWKQNEIADKIEKVRPWLKAYVSWPVPGEQGDTDSSDDDEEEEEEGEEGEVGVQVAVGGGWESDGSWSSGAGSSSSDNEEEDGEEEGVG